MLVIGKVWPEPASSAAGSRMMDLIRVFKEEGWIVEFASAASESEYSVDLRSMGIPCHSVQMNDHSFDSFIKAMDPDAVLFDRFMTEEQFGWRVTEQCPNAIRILDTEDLHCLREGRRLALKQGRAFITNDLNNEVAKREIASIFRCDLSLIISEMEMKLLQDHFRVDASQLVYLPFMLENAELSEPPDFSERADFVSIGNFLHEPNWDAVHYLKERIWPLIRKELPYVNLHIYGAYPTDKVYQLHSEKEGFLVKGRAEDARKVIGNSKVLVAPLRFGAGLKGKLLDAMITGTPSVTTSIGAEGMNGDNDWPGAIEDDPEQFAKACIRIYTDEKVWQKSQSLIQPLLVGRFLMRDRVSGLLHKLDEISSDLTAHRSKNFIGTMLTHHTLSSTRYMSKWIEEKNKPK